MILIVYAGDFLGIFWVVFDTIYQICKVCAGIDTIKPWERMYSRKSCIFWWCLRKGILTEYNRDDESEKYHHEKDFANGEEDDSNANPLALKLVSQPGSPGLTKFQNSAQEKKESVIVSEKRSDIPKTFTPEFQ